MVGGLAVLGVALVLNRWSVLLASFVVGLTFAWKKVPVDTMVQEAVPDGMRGRVFAVYDVAYNLARLLAAILAIWLLPTLGVRGAAAFVGMVFLIWAPVLPMWLRHAPEIRLRFAQDSTVPHAIRWGGVEEPVTVVTSQGIEGAPRTGLPLGVGRRNPDGRESPGPGRRMADRPRTGPVNPWPLVRSPTYLAHGS